MKRRFFPPVRSAAAKKFSPVLMFLFMVMVSCVSDPEPDGAQLSIGDSLPQFSVEMNNGQTVSTQSLRGKAAVIVFFNTDCPDCREELPVIQRLWDIYKENQQVEIVTIAREESKTKIEDYWSENDLTMPFSPQESRDIYSLFARSIIPRIYVADQNSVIIRMFGDSDMPSLEQLTSVLEIITAE